MKYTKIFTSLGFYMLHQIQSYCNIYDNKIRQEFW